MHSVNAYFPIVILCLIQHDFLKIVAHNSSKYNLTITIYTILMKGFYREDNIKQFNWEILNRLNKSLLSTSRIRI